MTIQPFQTPRRSVRILLVLALLTVCLVPTRSLTQTPADDRGLKPILDYISSGWDTLTRSMAECQSVVDPKIAAPSVLYLPAGFQEPDAIKGLSGSCNVRVEHLPTPIHRLGEIDTSNFNPPGLLYLPEKYVVPGGASMRCTDGIATSSSEDCSNRTGSNWRAAWSKTSSSKSRTTAPCSMRTARTI